MIPKKMERYLREHLPSPVLETRVLREDGMCFLEFGHNDEQLLGQLGITADKLGPNLVACVWNEATDLQIGGYLVVDNLSMGSPSMGGIRMLPDITPVDIHNLARGMTLKNGAANLPYGGGKSGIVAPNCPTKEQRHELIRGFARLIRRYHDIYVPGPDVGINDSDMKTVAIENGLDSAVSKPADMGGNRIDELGGAAGGVVIALQTLLKIMPRLRVLPQFANLNIPEGSDLKVLIQGFGAVGAHAARIMKERLPEIKVIGVSDIQGYLYDENGLPVETLFKMWFDKGLVTKAFYHEQIELRDADGTTKFSTQANDLLRESAFCMVPAAAVFNYLGVLPDEKASMNVEQMGKWSVIVEGANTYSPDPNKRAARMRMEQIVYRQKGVMIANDYLVNSGGVIFAAQEHMVKTPDHLQIPQEMLGNAEKVEKWLEDHKKEFTELSRERLKSGQEYREKVIRRNMIELVKLLAEDIDLLPAAAAEQVSLRRLSAAEHERRAKDIMAPIQTIGAAASIQQAAAMIITQDSNMIAVVDADRKLMGVATAWDIAKALAKDLAAGADMNDIMTREVVSASPEDTLVNVLSRMEQNQISAMPLMDKQGLVVGMVNSDLLAHRYLRHAFQSHRLNF